MERVEDLSPHSVQQRPVPRSLCAYCVWELHCRHRSRQQTGWYWFLAASKPPTACFCTTLLNNISSPWGLDWFWKSLIVKAKLRSVVVSFFFFFSLFSSQFCRLVHSETNVESVNIVVILVWWQYILYRYIIQMFIHTIEPVSVK